MEEIKVLLAIGILIFVCIGFIVLSIYCDNVAIKRKKEEKEELKKELRNEVFNDLQSYFEKTKE